MNRGFMLAMTLFTAGFGQMQTALAHGLVCQCKVVADQQIVCKGSFADGGGAGGVTVDVIGSDEQTLVQGTFAEDSTFTFKRPAGDFYVLMDVGAGHTLEVEQAQIEGLR
jgi:hypothetical protein